MKNRELNGHLIFYKQTIRMTITKIGELISNQIILDPRYRRITLIYKFAYQIIENGYLNL